MKTKYHLQLLDFDGSTGPDIPFRVESFEEITPDVRYEFPHRHSYYLVIFVEKAQGHHVIDFVPHRFRPTRFTFYLRARCIFGSWKRR